MLFPQNHLALNKGQEGIPMTPAMLQILCMVRVRHMCPVNKQALQYVKYLPL